MAQVVYDIHVYVPTLRMTLYVQTYAAFASADAAKAHFLILNPHRAPEHVTVTERTS